MNNFYIREQIDFLIYKMGPSKDMLKDYEQRKDFFNYMQGYLGSWAVVEGIVKKSTNQSEWSENKLKFEELSIILEDRIDLYCKSSNH